MDDSYYYYDSLELVHVDDPEPQEPTVVVAAAAVAVVQEPAATRAHLTSANDVPVLPDAADPPQDLADVSRPFHYEEEQYRLFEPVIGSEERVDNDPYAIPEIEEDDTHPDYTLRALRAVCGDAPALALSPTQASLRASDFDDARPAFEQIYTRVTDAVSALQSGASLKSARMFVASLFHTEKLLALHTLRHTRELCERALGNKKRAALFETMVQTAHLYRSQVLGHACDLTTTTRDCGTRHLFLCPRTRLVRARTHGANALPWLLSVDATDWLSTTPRVPVAEWLHVVYRHVSFPVASMTAPSVLDARFTSDVHWMPPSIWLRVRVPPIADEADLTAAQTLLRALQPTVLDISMTPLHDDLATLVSDPSNTRRLRCLRLRLDVHSQALRNLACLDRLFAVMQALPPSCQRLEIIRADFTYGKLIDHWEQRCPVLLSVAVVFIEPTSITNTVVQKLGTNKFKRLSIWKPITSQVLHAPRP